MARQIKDENGRVYKEKKPFYKRVWFWIIIIIIIAFALGSQGASKKSSNGGTKVESSTQSSEASSDEKEFYAVGDSVNVGDIIYTLNSVELTDERNEFDDTNPEYVVKIAYTMQNNTDSEVPVGMDVSAYGPDDKKLDSYPNENTMGSVASGKQIDVVQNFGVNSLGDMEFQFAPLVSIQKTADFKVNVQ